MKVIMVGYPDSVDTSVLPRDKSGIITSDGAISLSDGVIVGHAEVPDPPEPELIPHTHSAVTDQGSPVEE